ncbi:hypothetical protein C8Q76DRAFT_138614 [Earliella scabrosa]|nr:hypothetical protein C8Q76DRAFT_138614 [Earliella scabrosa]
MPRTSSASSTTHPCGLRAPAWMRGRWPVTTNFGACCHPYLVCLSHVCMRTGSKRLLTVFASQGRLNKEVARLATQLEDALQIFNIQSSLHMNEQLVLVSNAQVRLLSHADDADHVSALLLARTGGIERGVAELIHRGVTERGTLKLFGREEVDLLEEIGPEAQWPVAVNREPVMRYRAELRQTGRLVVVRRFPRADDRFRAAVELSERIWHPYIVQTLGISRPDPTQAFIVRDHADINGQQLLEYTNALDGVERTTQLLQWVNMTFALTAASRYKSRSYRYRVARSLSGRPCCAEERCVAMGSR